MRIVISVVVIALVFSSIGLWLGFHGDSKAGANMNYGISMTIDKISYSVREPIMMTLKIFNYTEEDVVFHFNTSQRYDFIIENEEGNEIWRWSQDMMFAMVLGEETLGPTNPEIIYTVEYKGKLIPGYYKITGIFIAQDRPMSGNIIIMVK
ncbi:MAG: BsuPI-related putative proteinase inhibitor [Candidatus Atribacteria bacterium]|nr:BsuPI-related putative proteinase inhibitor [Candidatus Atribacteria bacterium]